MVFNGEVRSLLYCYYHYNYSIFSNEDSNIPCTISGSNRKTVYIIFYITEHLPALSCAK